MKKIILCCILFMAISRYHAAASPEISSAPATQSLPLLFIENKGQFRTTDDQPVAHLHYAAKTPQMTVFISNNSLQYTFAKPDKDLHSAIEEKDTTAVNYTLQRMDVVLEGANTVAKVIAEDKQDYYENYYGPGYAITEVATYKKLVVKDVYPHIDWVLYINSDSKLKYDFVVREGGKATDIRLKYKGADKIMMNADGSITAVTPLGSVTDNAPVAYKAGTKEKVPCSFRLDGEVLGFDMKGYAGPVVIDPTLSWATYYGGSGDDPAYGLHCDAAGNVYMAGTTTSASNIATPGTFLSTYQAGTGNDRVGYVVKFNNNGVRQWATYHMGVYYYYNRLPVTSDGWGNVYLAFETGTAGMGTPGTHQQAISNNRDGFVVKFNNNGARQWATYYGGWGSDGARAVACDASGNVYVAGQMGSNGMATPGAHQVLPAGGFDGFLAKFDGSGQRLWATYYGGTSSAIFGSDEISALACYDNNVYIAGITQSDNAIATPGSLQTAYGGGYDDHFLAKFTDAGARVWGTYYGGSGAEALQPSIALDDYGNVYLAGSTNSVNNIATPGSYQPVSTGGIYDVYLAKFNPAGTRQWGTYYTGNASELEPYVVCDHADHVFLAARSTSTANISLPCSYQDTTVGHPAGSTFLARFSNNGVRQWATYYGGNFSLAFGLAADMQSNIYLCGFSQDPTLATPGTHQTTIGGTSDAFLTKFIQPTLFIASALQSSYCPGESFTLQYTTDLPFNNNNTFTVQLSDANGGWGSPVNIGSVTSSVSGSISCTIPASAPGGNKYRVRVVASSPQGISPSNCAPLTIHTVPVPTLTALGPATVCTGDTVWLSASGVPGPYTWKRNGVVIAGASGNTYAATVTGSYTVSVVSGTCTGTSNAVMVTINQLPAASITTNGSNIICSGKTLLLTAPTGTGYTYVWMHNGTIITGATAATYAATQAGTYTVAIHALPCPSDTSAPLNLIVKPTPPPPAVTPAYNYCPFDVAVPLQAAGQNLLWYNGSLAAPPQTTVPLPSTTTAGITTWLVTQTVDGCESAPATIVVTVFAKPQPPTVQDVFLCTGDMAVPINAGGQNLLWYTTATGGVGSTVAPLPNTGSPGSATHYVSQTVNGCESDRAMITVKVNEKTDALFTLSRDTICQGDTVTAFSTVPNPASALYQWDFGGATILSGANNGPYVLRFTGTGARQVQLEVVNGHCSAMSAHNIYVRTAGKFDFSLQSDACVGDTAELQFNWEPGWDYAWVFDGATIHDTVAHSIYQLTWNTTGIKTIRMEVTKTGACPALPKERTIHIHEAPYVKIENVSSTDICSGDAVVLHATAVAGYSYQWMPERFFAGVDQGSEATGLVRKTGNIMVKVTDMWGCDNYDSVYVHTRPCCEVFLPDAFTPNGDGVNDKFRIVTQGHHQVGAFRVVNRWGELVFSTAEQSVGWDGRQKGIEAEAGTYFYYLKYKCDNGEVYEKKGTVILLR